MILTKIINFCHMIRVIMPIICIKSYVTFSIQYSSLNDYYFILERALANILLQKSKIV